VNRTAASISVPGVLLEYEQVRELPPDLLSAVRAISAECGYDPGEEQ
jgi:hypothetical protein